MKRKILIVLFVATIVACTILLVGCNLGGLGGDGGWNGQKVALAEEHFFHGFVGGLRTYFYNGSPIRVEDDIMINTPDNRTRVDNDLFDFTYTNNINVGKATVTVTAKEENPYYYGSVKFEFTIDKGIANVTTSAQLIAELNGDNVYQINVLGDVDLGNAQLTVKQGVYVYIQPNTATQSPRVFRLSGSFTNNGKIVLEDSKSSYSPTEFITSGLFVNNGEIALGDNCALYNSGQFTNNNKVTLASNSANVYTNDVEIANVLKGSGQPATQHVRAQIAEENVKLTFTSTYYNEDAEKNKPIILIQVDGYTRYAQYTYNYRNFQNAGTAYVDIVMDAHDTNFYGNITVPYEIKRTMTRAQSVEQITALQATGNYDKFYGEQFTINAGESLTLNEGILLEVNMLYVFGRLVNDGEVRVYAEPGSKFSVTGYLYVNNQQESGAGQLENNGKLTTRHLLTYPNGSVTNSGKMTVDEGECTISATFTNTQNATLTVNSDLKLLGRLINHGEITITTQSYMLIDNLDSQTNGLENTGRIKIDGEVVCRSLDSLTNSGAIENTDTVWTYVALEGFSNVVVKRQITLADVVFTNATPVYDGTAKPAIFAEESGLKEGQYTVKYAYEGKDASSAAPINAGRLKLVITITDERTKYFCAQNDNDEMGILRDVDYEILRGEIAISTDKQLCLNAQDSNYARVYLIADVAFSMVSIYTSTGQEIYYDVTIVDGLTLDTNGYTLTFKSPSSLINNGTLLNSKAGAYGQDFHPTRADCGIVVQGGAKIVNNGVIVNNNIMLFAPRGHLQHGEHSRIENTGQIYLVDLLPDEVDVTGSGQIYQRENLSTLQDDKTRVTLEYWEVEFTGQEFFPAVTIYSKNGLPVDVTEDRFTVRYTNMVQERRCSVSVAVADEFDEEFYGSANLDLTILKSVANVGTMEAFAEAASSPNYLGYRLTASFSLNKSVVLPAGTFLDMQSFSISTNSTIYKVDLTSGAQLWVSADSNDRLLNYLRVADKITITDDFVVEVAGYVSFSAQTMGKYTSNASSPFTKHYLGLTIDLNGHSVGGWLNVQNKYSPDNDYFALSVIDTSPDKTGRLGSGDQYHGLNVDGQTPLYVNMDGVKVGGLALSGTVYLTATGCQLETTFAGRYSSAAYYCGGSSGENITATFTNCVFSGYSGVYVDGGSHVFVNCDISAHGEYVSRQTGSALLINGYGVRVGVDGGSLHSVNGYCMEITYQPENTADVQITTRTDVGQWTFGKDQAISNPLWYESVEDLS